MPVIRNLIDNLQFIAKGILASLKPFRSEQYNLSKCALSVIYTLYT